RWDGNISSVPLTSLEAGGERFFGGPARWLPRVRSRKKSDDKREWVAGRSNFDPEGLQPGQQTEGFVCTDGGSVENGKGARQVVRHLFGEDEAGARVKAPYRGPLLWRVQVRRGRVWWRDAPRSATTVIGVRFTDRDYRRGG